jgi:AAA15 family ATPase/GTPase
LAYFFDICREKISVMLISFAVENWKSFGHRQSFSFVPGKESKKRNRLLNPKHGVTLSPIAAVFGPNASGKTNFILAIKVMAELAQKRVELGVSLPYSPFKLDEKSASLPSYFGLEFLLDGQVYYYEISFHAKTIVMERLSVLTASSEKVIFKREGQQMAKASKKEILAQARLIMQVTPENQPFAFQAAQFNLHAASHVFRWFAEHVLILGTQFTLTDHSVYLLDGSPHRETMGTTLQALGTGITQLDTEKVDWGTAQLDGQTREKLEANIGREQQLQITSDDGKRRFRVFWEDDELVVHKIVAVHRGSGDQLVTFEMSEESEGTRKLIDLLPALEFLSRKDKSRLLIVDELDRSLHTSAVRALLESFLDQITPDSTSQLLFTTHDLMLMDQEIFRRDELWLCEKDAAGQSSLVAFSDYKDVRYDTHLRNLYLSGRVSGLPMIDALNVLKVG